MLVACSAEPQRYSLCCLVVKAKVMIGGRTQWTNHWELTLNHNLHSVYGLPLKFMRLLHLRSYRYYQNGRKVIGSLKAAATTCVIGLLLSATDAFFQWTVGKLWWWLHLCGNCCMISAPTGWRAEREPIHFGDLTRLFHLGERDLYGHRTFAKRELGKTNLRCVS